MRECTRTEVGLTVESGEPRDVHHFACLIGYGAGTVNPYLVFESLVDMERDGYLPEGLDAQTAEGKFIWLEWTAESIPEEGLIFATARDVSIRQRREASS